MLNVWSVKTGYSLGTLQERRVTSITLPTTGDLTGVTFTKISGSLPLGLRLESNRIVGTTFEVSRTTTSTFVIRASNGIEISDRTFTITVEGADAPVWITPGGNPDLVIVDFSNTKQYAIGRLVRYAGRVYEVIAEVPKRPAPNDAFYVEPPDTRYYSLYVEENNVLPVGVDPQRISNIVSISRNNFDIVTITTDLPHNFVGGNKITVDTTYQEINTPSATVKEVTTYTLTYYRRGAAIPTTTVTGLVSLIKDPLTFVLDGTYIDFQLQAADTDLRAGDELEYFIAENDGELPPGLTLSTSGRITGFIDPILALDVTARKGFFDSDIFDAYPFDYGIPPNIGIEDYYSVQTPRKLNRFYEFIVTVTDGESPSRRKFKIYVVGDDFLRADNTIMKIGDGTFSADVTYLRSPVWLSASNLGIKRANNYVTVILDAFDPNPAVGPVDYRLEALNPDGTASELPPGLFLDSSNSEIFGFVPYQPAVTIDYTFTISAVKYDKENIEQIAVSIVVYEDTPYGQNFLRINKLPVEDQLLITNDTIRIGGYVYKITAYEATDTVYDIIRLDKNLQDNLTDGFVIEKTYNRLLSQDFTTRKSSKTFTMQILGEVDSVIRFITPSNLGSIRANIASRLEIQAETSVIGAVLTYQLVAGTLPPGVELKSNGELIGRVTQFGNIVYRSFWKTGRSYKIDDVVKYNNLLYRAVTAHVSANTFTTEYWERYTFLDNVTGLTTFDNRTTTFDGRLGTLDRSYKFTVLAQDQFKFSAIKQTFTVFVEDPDVKLFSNIYAKPYPSKENRNIFYSFINNLDIFTPDKIYRSSDPEYGVQKDLKMLVYAGIETLDISNYISALTRNTKRKRFKLGSPKKAIAKETGSNSVIYEVIYLEVFDEYERGTDTARSRIQLINNSKSKVKVNQARINPVDGKLGTVANGSVTYTSTEVQNKLNGEAVDYYRPVKDPVTVDTSAVKASGNDFEYAYPSSIRNIRNNIKNLMVYEYYQCISGHTSTVFSQNLSKWSKLPSDPGNSQEWYPSMIYNTGEIVRVLTRQIDTENSFLPQWMITPQNSRTAATGFIKAIPLCYCKPGEADYILQNIENSGFDFTQLDYEIDRFIIDSVSGDSADQYLKFPNFKYNI